MATVGPQIRSSVDDKAMSASYEPFAAAIRAGAFSTNGLMHEAGLGPRTIVGSPVTEGVLGGNSSWVTDTRRRLVPRHLERYSNLHRLPARADGLRALVRTRHATVAQAYFNSATKPACSK
jgi:hypothetical protein